jgi:nitronate monooxygenase
MSTTTRLAEQLGMRHPIVSAPMEPVGGGRLAGAAAAAAGLGLLGGGYTEHADWFERAFAAAGDQSAGFITWTLRPSRRVRDVVVARQPKAIFLSFEDPAPFSKSRGDGPAGVLSTANR